MRARFKGGTLDGTVRDIAGGRQLIVATPGSESASVEDFATIEVRFDEDGNAQTPIRIAAYQKQIYKWVAFDRARDEALFEIESVEDCPARTVWP